MGRGRSEGGVRKKQSEGAALMEETFGNQERERAREGES